MPNIPRLCGGTFFLQVLLMKQPMSRKKSKGLNGEKDLVNNQRILEALIQLFKPDFAVYSDGTFKGDVSDYRACKEEAGTNLPFTDKYSEGCIPVFDTIVRNDYGKILPRIKRFVNTYINGKKAEPVIKALLSCIEQDDSIRPEDKFYMGEMGHPITKDELIHSTDISLDSFLLGLWHFIVTNRKNNRIGRETFEDWNKHVGEGKTWKYVSKIGKDYHDIFIHRTGDTVVINKQNAAEDNYEDVILEEDTENYETDNSDDPGLDRYKQYFIQQIFINNGTFIQQNAEKIYNIGYVDHLD